MIESNLDKLFNYFINYGAKDYIGEPVTQTEHMFQAALQAENNNEDTEVVLAALFHDLGHLVQLAINDKNSSVDTKANMGKYGVKNHEKIGSGLLRDLGFKYPVPELVENHVKVKKYRTYKDKEYYKKLSEASKKTLEYQGGPMTEDEALEFESDPLFNKSLRIRNYDDAAKIPNMEIKKLEYYKDLARQYLLNL